MSNPLSIRKSELALAVGDRLPRPPPTPTRADALWEWSLRLAIVVSLAVVLWVTFHGHGWLHVYRDLERHRWTDAILRPSILWAFMGTVMLAVRTALWFGYRAFPSARFEDAPPLTVVIPAYNEGKMVEKSIESVATARYPHDRLEIFVVDDGSKDDTWEYIQRAAARYPGLVTAVRLEKNQGKRHALATGFRRARGDVVVTIDSDSVIDEGTLLAMAGAFADPKVGAVAGRVAVYNRDQGVIPRMLRVRFTLAFDFLRAAQSTYRTVYCCPGALAGYRASVLREVLDAWMGQKFLGVACTYGEDRAMTNWILARGYDTVYQRTAVVFTIVPWTYSRLCKMYLRWDRSYVREELRLARIVWRRRGFSLVMSVVDGLITNLRYPVAYATLVLLVYASWEHPFTVVRLMFVIGAMSTMNMLYYLRSERSWDVVYGVLYAYFSFFGLFWIFPYAVFTVRAKGWLTR